MKSRSTKLMCRAIALPLGLVWIVGCGQNPLDESRVGVQFQSPQSSVAVRDDQSLPIRFAVKTDHPVTARVELDLDDVIGNGNELQLAADQAFESPGGEAKIDFVAGQISYGSYRLRVTLSDGASSAEYSPAGFVHIVPMFDAMSSDNQGGLNILPDVEGLRLLYTNGLPNPVNSRVPFLATWDIPDTHDQLSPVFVQPLQVDKAMTIHRMQFYAFGHSRPEAKRIDIYSGTDSTTPGILMRRIDADMTSFPTGGWNIVRINPPLTLQPGQYGISFHGCCEFSENWGAGATGGPGYVLMSRLQGVPFTVVTKADLGFSPSFTMRLLGTMPFEDISASPTSRAIVPVDPPVAPPPVASYPTDGDKPAEGLCDKEDGDEDRLGGSTPFHVTWGLMKP